MNWCDFFVLCVWFSGGMYVVRQTTSVSQLGFQQMEISPVYVSQGLFSNFCLWQLSYIASLACHALQCISHYNHCHSEPTSSLLQFSHWIWCTVFVDHAAGRSLGKRHVSQGGEFHQRRTQEKGNNWHVHCDVLYSVLPLGDAWSRAIPKREITLRKVLMSRDVFYQY